MPSCIKNWSKWANGDLLGSPGVAPQLFTQQAILSLLQEWFPVVTTDYETGDRWLEWRIAKLIEVNAHQVVIESDRAVLGKVPLVTVKGDPSSSLQVQFFLYPFTDGFELRYEPADSYKACQSLAKKIAAAIGFKLTKSDE